VKRRSRTILFFLLKNLAFIAITLLMLEVALRLFNPLGVYGLVYDLNIMNPKQMMHDWGRVMRPGVYDLYSSVMTIDEDHYRVIPANNPEANCTIVIVGDSVAQGYRVSDEDIWVNHIAAAFQSVNFINASNYARNIDDAQLTITVHDDADGYLYLVVDNDHEESIGIEDTAPTHRITAIGVYFTAMQEMLSYREETGTDVELTGPQSTIDEQLAHFYAVLDDIVQDERTLVIGFEGDYDFSPPVQQIPPYTDVISPIDPHPNPQGHRFIAGQVRPILEAWLPMVCS